MKEENNTKAARIKRGDTLDYYNDSLPKKAVESLFDNDDNTSSGYISGYDDDDDTGVVIQDTLAYKDRTPRRLAKRADDALEENISAHSKQNTRSRKDIFEPEDITPKPRRPRDKELLNEPKARQSTRPRVRYEPVNSAEDDYNMNDDIPKERTRGNTRPRDYEALPDDEQERQVSRRDTFPRRDPLRRLSAGEALRDTRPDSSDTGPTRRRTDRQRTADKPPIPDSAPDRYSTRTERERTGRQPQVMSNNRRYPNSQTKTAANRLFDEDTDTESPISVKTIAIGVTAFVVLGLFVMLVMRINSLQREVVDLRTAADTAAAAQDSLTQKEIENDRLQTQVRNLEQEVADYKQLTQSLSPTDNQPTDATDSPSGGTANGTTSSQTPPPNTNVTPVQNRTHEVVSGNTLGGIARQYYGEGSRANIDKIKAANSLTSDDIQIGQKLIIPD